MTGTQGGTDIMTHVMALRSRKTTKAIGSDATKTDEDSALIIAEESLMEDEEIDSLDEFVNPIVDLAKLEERNLSVAMSRSVLDIAGGHLQGTDVDDCDKGGHRRYGLRMRQKSNLAEIPRSSGSAFVNQTDTMSASSGSDQRPKDRAEYSKPSHPANISQSQRIPKPPDTQLPSSEPKSSQSHSLPMQRPPRLPISSQNLQSSLTSHGVPNPLANISTPLKPPPLIPHVPPISTASSKVASVASHTSSVPCPLPAVPCPLAPSIQLASKSVIIPTAVHDSNTLEFSSSDLISNRRGRIFSMDIDAAGLDFPDMSVDNLASDFDSPALRPLSDVPSNPLHSNTDDPTSDTLGRVGDPVLPGVTPFSAPISAFHGRDRAMSFEFFSLGINADEPLPPVSEDNFMFQRPRGDSIIFDPVSFQDGGIHEEKALFRSRECSIDLPSRDEIAIMNAPGFVAPPPIPFDPPKPVLPDVTPSSSRSTVLAAPMKPSDQSPQPVNSIPPQNTMMATLPSSLNTTLNHATFQMDLLNKDGRIGIYLPDARRARIAKFHSKRKMRIWRKRIKYDCRKKLADSRPRIKGRFVKRTDMDDE